MPLTRGLLLAALVVASGCSSSAQTASTIPTPSTASAGSCDALAAVGAPITGRLLLDGCTTETGSHVEIPYGPCRGTGNVTAGLELGDRRLTGELDLDWEEEPVPERTYGTWSRGLQPDEDVDVSGCILRWPDDPPAS